MNGDTIVTIGNDYSFTIPPALRDLLGWKPGTRLALIPQADGSVAVEEVEPAPAGAVSKGRRKRSR